MSSTIPSPSIVSPSAASSGAASSGTQQVVMVDTSCANISSLKFAMERLGYEVLVSADTQVISQADKVLLPGVGSAAAAMAQIRAKGLVECLQGLQQPVLGICLGMQLMTNRSEEANAKGQTVPCLGLVDTEVNAMKNNTAGVLPAAETENSSNNTASTLSHKPNVTQNLRLPHMGWNQVTGPAGNTSDSSLSDSPLFYGIDENTYFYFVHGYCVPTGKHTIASCNYTKPFSAAIQNGNFMGVQFHPERSGEAGAKLLRNFVELV